MTLAELLPKIRSLPRGEKLRLIQLLADDVAQNEEMPFDAVGKTVAIWSPYDSFQGAATLLEALNEGKTAS